jgi:UDP-N-acetylmuramate--alanine ligase
MSAVALLAKDLGHSISGSADAENDRTEFLRKRGIEVYIGHRRSNLRSPDCVVYTNAIHPQNEERLFAFENGFRMLPRLLFLGHILKNYPREIIGITGTDGKSTTTAMIAHILKEYGTDPTVLLGGLHQDLEEGNYRRGQGPLVMEVDESDGYLKDFSTHYACFTNIHGDHLEHYEKDFVLYRNAILSFLCHSQQRIIPEAYMSQYLLYKKENGIAGGRDHLFSSNGQIDQYFFELIPGKHNRYNASCAIKVCEVFGVPPAVSKRSLESFRFVDRRFSIRYDSQRLTIIDDYAHTPREITAVLQAVKEKYPEARPIIIFEAHRYTRLEREFHDFVRCLSSPDIFKVFVLPIYSAYEEKKPDLFEKFLCELQTERPGTVLLTETQPLIEYVRVPSEEDLVLLFVGAGNSSGFSKALAKQLEVRDWT